MMLQAFQTTLRVQKAVGAPLPPLYNGLKHSEASAFQSNCPITGVSQLIVKLLSNHRELFLPSLDLMADICSKVKNSVGVIVCWLTNLLRSIANTA